MEFGVREWIILVGVLLVLAVLLDAYRRFRNEQRNTIRMAKMSVGMGGGYDEEEEDYGHELPNGGGRVVSRSAAEAEARKPIEPTIGPEPAVEEPADNPEQEAEDEQVIGSYLEDMFEEGEAGSEASEKVLVIHVVPNEESGFDGGQLLKILEACDLRHGNMGIFHRHEAAAGEGPVQFSVASLVEPGSFDLEFMPQSRVPGVSLFLSLPGPAEPEMAFDCMLETARCVAKNLDGTLNDHSHEALTEAMLDRCRQDIQDFVSR
jgi:cell division protein ZipA